MTEERKRSYQITSEGKMLIAKIRQERGWNKTKLNQYLQEKTGIETIPRILRLGKAEENSIDLIAQALGILPTDLVDPNELYRLTEPIDTMSSIVDWRSVSKGMLEDLKRLTTEALTAGDDIRFDFDDVFVPLGVVERRERSKRKEDDGAPDRGSELYEEKVTPITHDEFFKDVLLRGNTRYSDGKRIAVIGEAGAGKTTQLQKIGSWLHREESDDIPVWISLTDLGAKSLREYLFENWVREASGEIEAAPQAWKDSLGDAIKSGKVWLLLDGVDEMTVSNPLSHLSTQLNESWLKNVRVVLTCRVNVWDGGKNSLTGFDIYRNLDFDYPNDVYKFIGKWFARAPELAGSLTQALEQSGKERIRDMVKNPLRLTLLCYSWQLKQGELPETKAGLYKWFVEAFYKWNKSKAQIELSRSQEKQLNRALGELAKRAIDGETSRFRLTKTFIENVFREFDIDLFDLALKLNWLNEIGVAAENPLETVYAFYHPSFQEYFAALAIDDWDFFVPRDHINKSLQDRKYCIFEPRWQEVIAFWIGRKDENLDKESLIKALIEFEDGCKDFYWHRAYFLAATCLIEFKNCKFAKQIIEQIIEWTYTYSHVNIQYSYYGFYISSLDNQAYTTLITLSQFQVYNKFIVDRLSKLLKSPEIDENSSVLIAEILGTIDFGNPNALFYLVQIFKNSKFKKPELKSYSATCWRAKSSLEQLAVGDLNTISMLTEILQDPLICEDTHSLVLNILKIISVNHIEEAGSESPANFNNITNSLEELQRFLGDEYIQYRKIMPMLEECVDTVNNLIAGNEELDTQPPSNYSDVRLFFHKKLVDIVNEEIAKNKEIETKKAANFIDIEYFFYRVFWCENNEFDEIVCSLEKLAVGDTESISVLVDTLKYGQFDNYIRYRLAKCLETIDRSNVEACSSLIKIILENKHLSYEAAYHLSERAVGNAEVISILVNTLQNEQLDDSTRYNLAKVIGKIDTGNVIAISILIEFLLKSINDKHPDTSEAELLGEVGTGNSDVINLLLKILRDTKSTDEMCNSVLVGLLSALNGLPEKEIELWKLDVIRSVEATLQRTPVLSDVNWLAAEVLSFVDAGNTTAISALSNLLLNFKSYSCSYRNDDSDDSDGIQSLVNIFTSIVAGGSISSWQFAVNKLREGVNNKTYKNIYNNFNCCYESLWHCAQNMGYQDFYDGWHSSTNTIQYLEHQLLDCDAIQKELDRNTDHPKIRCLVIDIRHLEQESDPNVIAKKLTNKIFNSIGRRIPVVQDISCLERELLNLKFDLGFEKLAIALYGKSANEAINQLCQSLTESIPIRLFTGGQTTEELITQINAWLSEM